LYKLELVGSKSLIPREREVNKYFLSNMNPENFEIDGCKIGVSGITVMENSTSFLISNECTFSNVYQYMKSGGT